MYGPAVQPEWRVLLVGGSAGVGKTTAARELARRLSISVLLVDDVRLALQEVTTHVEQPDLHRFLSYEAEQWREPKSIHDDWIVVAQAMVPALKVIIAHHVVVGGVGPIIIEGDGILPSLATQQSFSELKHFQGLEPAEAVQAVFLVEGEEEQVWRNLAGRGRGFDEWATDEQRAFAHASWLFGQWLAGEAEAHGLPVVAARPFETCAQRILAAIEGGAT
jgi:2-phosphoglycerate kinase